VVLLTLVSNCTWAKVLENLTVSKLSFIFYSTLIFPFSLFYLFYYCILFTLKNLNYQSFSVLLVFLYFWAFTLSNFLFFIVHGIQRFSNRCLNSTGFGFGFPDLWVYHPCSLRLFLSCPCHRLCRPSIFIFLVLIFFCLCLYLCLFLSLSFCRP
jgi:hypothetical protein